MEVYGSHFRDIVRTGLRNTHIPSVKKRLDEATAIFGRDNPQAGEPYVKMKARFGALMDAYLIDMTHYDEEHDKKFVDIYDKFVKDVGFLYRRESREKKKWSSSDLQELQSLISKLMEEVEEAFTATGVHPGNVRQTAA